MSSTVRILETRSEEMTDLIERFCEESNLYNWTESGGPALLVSSNPYAFSELSPEGYLLQARLNVEFRKFALLCQSIVSVGLQGDIDFMAAYIKTVKSLIEHNRTSHSSVESVCYSAVESVGMMIELLLKLHDDFPGETVVVPDTNALIGNPAIVDWSFEKFEKFRVVILPTVISEIDHLKIAHEKEAVRKKAQSLIRRFKDYRNRGKLTEGVILRKGVSTLQAIAIEPNMEEALPWLDPSNADDRILAGVLEVAKMRPHSNVVLITADLNMQNKAELAELPYLEPPATSLGP